MERRVLLLGPLRVLALLLLLCWSTICLQAADKAESLEGTPPKTAAENPTEAQQALRAYLQLQEQLHQTILNIDDNRKAILSLEQNQKQSEAAAKRNTDILAAEIHAVETAVSRQRDEEIKSARNSNRFAILVAASLGTVGLLLMVLTAWLLMKTARQFSTVAALTTPALRAPSHLGLLSDGGMALRGGAAEESGVKLLGAIERLEKRIYHIEQTGALPEKSGTDDHDGPNGKPETDETPEVALLLGKGQSLLHLDQAEEAMACFDEALDLDPKNAEALVKKGTALERLRRFEDAIECYDRALSFDDSMTLAYLYKGGVFNQLERFGEALECYEKALRTQQKVAAR